MPPGNSAVPACLCPARPGCWAHGGAAGGPWGVQCSWRLRLHARPPGHAGRAGSPPSPAPGGPATMAPAMAPAGLDTTAQLRAALPAALLRPSCRPGLYPLPGLRARVDMWVLWLGPPTPQDAWEGNGARGSGPTMPDSVRGHILGASPGSLARLRGGGRGWPQGQWPGGGANCQLPSKGGPRRAKVTQAGTQPGFPQ